MGADHRSISVPPWVRLKPAVSLLYWNDRGKLLKLSGLEFLLHEKTVLRFIILPVFLLSPCVAILEMPWSPRVCYLGTPVCLTFLSPMPSILQRNFFCWLVTCPFVSLLTSAFKMLGCLSELFQVRLFVFCVTHLTTLLPCAFLAEIL